MILLNESPAKACLPEVLHGYNVVASAILETLQVKVYWKAECVMYK